MGQVHNRRRISSIVAKFGVWVLLLVSAALNSVLGLRVSELENANRLLSQSRRLVIGSAAPPLEYVDSSQKIGKIQFQTINRPSLLYFYADRCYWCAANWKSFSQLIERLKGRYEIHVICVSTGDEHCNDTVKPDFGDYVKTHERVSLGSIREFDVSATPTLISLTDKGRVDRIWKGAFSGERRRDLESHFNVVLPEITLETTQVLIQ